MHRFKREFLLFLLIFCAFLRAESLWIFNTTDLHGNFFQPHKETGGTMRDLAARMKEERDRLGADRVLTIDCGDVLLGSRETSCDRGRCGIVFLNEIGCDLWIPGNHDFEYGRAVLEERIREFRGTFLCANLTIRNQAPAGWKIVEKKGFRIAVIGLTNAHTPEWVFQPENDGLHFFRMQESLRKIMPSVMKARPHLIVLAVHSGRFASKRFQDPENLRFLVRPWPQIRLVLGGHSHERVPGELLDRDSGAWFVQAGVHASGFIRIRVEMTDPKHPVLSSEFIPAVPNGKNGLPSLDGYFRSCREVEKRVLCHQTPRVGFSDPAAMAGLFHAAIRRKMPELKIAVHGILSRFVKEQGDLTELDLFRLCPYENTLVTARITPAQCRAILLEQQKISRNGMHQYVSGVRLDPDGKLRLDSGRVWSDPAERLAAGFNSFAAAGAGKRFPVLEKILKDPSSAAVNTGLLIRDLLRTEVQERWK